MVIRQNPTDRFRMGLETENIRVFESATTSFEIPFVNGKFEHGLSDADKTFVEKHYGRSFTNQSDADFWKNMVFQHNNYLSVKDPKSAESVLHVSVMKVLGIACTSEEPDTNATFVITTDEFDDNAKMTATEKFDILIGRLLDLKKTKKHLLAVAKYILPISTGIGQNETVAYLKLREYLDGKLTPTKKEALNTFEKVLEMDKTRLYVTTDFREAFQLNIVRRDNAHFFYNPISDTRYGKTEEEAITYLMDIKHQEEIGTWSAEDATFSIRHQLKQKQN